MYNTLVKKYEKDLDSCKDVNDLIKKFDKLIDKELDEKSFEN